MIKCHCCHQEYPINWAWWTCHVCGHRVCTTCLGRHAGVYGSGMKCSQCANGQMQPK